MASMALPPYNSSLVKTAIRGIKAGNKIPRPSLSNKTCVITGANSGIGLACVQILPSLGLSHLILGVRNISKGEEAARPLRQAHPGVKIDVWELDMLNYESIQRFAKQCAGLNKLDMAILNAGVGGNFASKNCAATGHEETIQVNYLSTALLSILLLPILSPNGGSEPGRLTIVGSGTALFASFENRTANPLLTSFDAPYSGFSAAGERYGTSKVLVLMLVHLLSQRVSADRVIINTVEPGLTSGTQLHRDFSGGGAAFMSVLKKLGSKTPEQAAQTYIDAIAVHGKESHGGFVMFWELCGMPKLMYDETGRKCMERLWKETMVELEFAGVGRILDSFSAR